MILAIIGALIVLRRQPHEEEPDRPVLPFSESKLTSGGAEKALAVGSINKRLNAGGSSNSKVGDSREVTGQVGGGAPGESALDLEQYVPSGSIWADQPEGMDNIQRKQSPDGLYDAFLSRKNGPDESSIAIYDRRQGTTEFVRTKWPNNFGGITEFAWNRDGKSILYSEQYLDPPDEKADDIAAALHYPVYKFALGTGDAALLAEIPSEVKALGARGDETMVVSTGRFNENLVELRRYNGDIKVEERLIPTGESAQRFQILADQNELWFTAVSMQAAGNGESSLGFVNLGVPDPVPFPVLESVLVFSWSENGKEIALVRSIPGVGGRSEGLVLDLLDRSFRRIARLARLDGNPPIPVGFDSDGTTVYFKAVKEAGLSPAGWKNGWMGIWEYKLSGAN